MNGIFLSPILHNLCPKYNVQYTTVKVINPHKYTSQISQFSTKQFLKSLDMKFFIPDIEKKLLT